jgi:predicted ribosome quality control (RQC) complex YloA/Tae2 family protein
MSLNWKEIDAVLSEMDLAGSQIQKVVQSAYDALVLQTRHNAKTTNLLVVLSGGCRC